MAGEATIGAVRALLGLDVAGFTKGLDKASKDLAAFQSSIKKVAAAVGVGLSFAAVTAAIKDTINELEQLNKVSQKIGVPVEELSALKFAAGLADISLDELSASLVKLAKNMVEVGKGSAGPAADAFNALEISVQSTEVGLKSQIDVIGDLADKFASFKDGAEKTAIAVAIFGKAGAAMIPLLNKGRAGLKESADEARRFGLIVDGETSESAEKFNDNLKRLQGASQGLIISLVQGLLPALNQVTDEMLATTEKGEGLFSLGETLGRIFTNVAFVLRANVAGFQTLGTSIIAFGKAVSEASHLEFAKALETLNTAGEKNKKTIEEFGKVWDEFWSEGDRQGQLDAVTAAWERMDVAARANAPTIRDVTKELDNFIKSTTENVQALRAQVATFGQSEGAIARAKFELQAMAKIRDEDKTKIEAQITAIKLFGGEIQTLTDKLIALGQAKEFKATIQNLGLQAREAAGEFTGVLAPGFIQAAQSLKLFGENGEKLGATLALSTEKSRALNDALFLLNAQRLAQEFLDPYERFQLKLKEIEESFKRLPENAKAFAEATSRAGFKMAADYGQVASAIVDPMASMFKDLASMNKKWAGAAKAAAIAQAIVNTYVAATKALADPFLPFPLNYAAAAAVTAAGLVNVAKISAQEFAQGGSFRVGGVGGTDSQLIQMALTPGEMVDVRKPGAETNISEITVNMRGRDIFTGDAIRDLFTAINQGTSDGYRLKVV